MKTICLFSLALVLVLAGSRPAAAQGVFLEIAGITTGVNPAGGPQNQSMVAAISFGATKPITIGTTTSVGSTNFSDISIIKQVDLASIKLLKALVIGQVQPTVKINFYNGTGALAYQIVLKNAYITSSQSSGANSGCTSGCPDLSESVSFTFSQITINDPAQSTNPLLWNVVTSQPTN